MAKKLGNNYRLWIESATAGTFNEVKGQQSLSYSQSTQLIDTSDKTNSPYGTSVPGLISVQISADLIPDLPDTNGFTRLESQFVNQLPTNFQIRKGGSSGAAPADVVYEGAHYVTQLNKSFGLNDAVKVQAQLAPASAPTTNTLA
ncbi:MAG: hypothetical protein RQ833_11525 [Sphingomonadaceae bacterium]|nr:hypothetical protein [Sphingomonadaceae bacterium]